MRVGIVGLLHESNTFIDRPTRWEHFQRDILLTGAAVREHFHDAHHEIGGFLQGLDASGAEAVPMLVARAVPYGMVGADTFRTLVARLLDAFRKAGPLDGLLVAPHGATVSAEHRDADGYWLGELRRRAGPYLPIVGTLDAHANVSRRMVEACDALIAYRTNPHLDQRERGFDAARLLLRTVRGEIRPVMAAAFPPMVINIERQRTSEPPCRPLYELADRQLRGDRLLSNSILLGFPYADVAEMGSATLAVADGDVDAAQRAANALADYLWRHRAEFEGQLVDVPTAVGRAAELPGPVCLLDMGDNVGGGSPADGTVLAHALIRNAVGASFICLYDPPSVQAAAAAGRGAHVRLAVGGKTDARHGPPLEGLFRVVRLCDGKFVEPEPRHGGFTHCDQGPTAIVQSGRMTVMLTSHRMPPFSLRQLASCGVDPREFQVLIAKGVHAPVAAYREVCRHLIPVDTPGATTADPRRLDYRHRRRPMFPFEPETEWTVSTGNR